MDNPISCPNCQAHNPTLVKAFNFYLCTVCDYAWSSTDKPLMEDWQDVYLCYTCFGSGILHINGNNLPCKLCGGNGWIKYLKKG
jgi:transposase-like protein